MSRPSTPLGRARSRSGTKSPATIADRAVHKIAGKSFLTSIRLVLNTQTKCTNIEGQGKAE